jgi:hypothetical protein
MCERQFGSEQTNWWQVAADTEEPLQTKIKNMKTLTELTLTMTKKLIILSMLAATTVMAQIPQYQIRQLPFSNGYGVYQNGIQTQEIRRLPFSNDWGVYQNGIPTQQIRRDPFSNNYTVYGYGY